VPAFVIQLVVALRGISMDDNEKILGRALLALDEIIDQFAGENIARTAMSASNQIGRHYADRFGTDAPRPKAITQQEMNDQKRHSEQKPDNTLREQLQRSEQQSFQQQNTELAAIEERLIYSLEWSYKVSPVNAVAPTLVKQASELAQAEDVSYKSSVFVCLEDYQKCRKFNRPDLCLSLLVLCVAKELIPFVKK
jgi:hypothetical protein